MIKVIIGVSLSKARLVPRAKLPRPLRQHPRLMGRRVVDIWTLNSASYTP